MSQIFGRPLSRREMLQQCGVGMGAVALAAMGGEAGLLAAPTAGEFSSPLAPKQPHFAPKAKHVIHLFMNGGPSQVDTFDPKPALEKWHGKLLDDKLKGDKRLGGAGFASPFKFKKYGKSGIEVSELFPRVAECIDDICVIRSMVTDIPNHEPGLMMMNCGDLLQKRPSVGSWMLYGLGTENQSLPGFVVMCAGGLPTAQSANWRSAFLPGVFQGTHIDTQNRQPEELIENVRNNVLTTRQQRRQLNLIQQLNGLHRDGRTSDPQLEARIESMELAFRMQSEALDAFDIAGESKDTIEMYGDTLHGRQNLIARRLVERGVRYVQIYHGAGQPWDSHRDLVGRHKQLTKESDQPIAALLADLKQRGLLDETLVVWGGEIGRTPTVQLPVNKQMGRDHHNDGFVVWLAGGGVKGGYVHGATDELGLHAVENPVHVHDLHATMLHLMGFDHKQLTYRYAGRDMSLTDIHGRVVQEILA